MKIKTLRNLLAILSLLLIVGLIGCEGPEGPAGPKGDQGNEGSAGNDGADGADGADGSNGINGVDGADGANGLDMTSSSCLSCHNDDTMFEKRFQLNMHDHATMANSLSRGGRESCGRCHSHENFRRFVQTGSDASLETVTGLTCKSCHTLHDSETVADFSYNVLIDTPVEYLTGGTYSFGANNSSNLCLQCHSPRRDFTAYDATPEDGADSVAITSSHAGPHYGMMGLTIFGEGADVRNGTTALDQGQMAHASVGCVSCHMGSNDDHSFVPTTANCENCHAGAADFDINGAATKMHDAIVVIEAKLVEIGWYSEGEDGISSNASGSAPLEMSGAEFTAFWNYQVIHADHGSIYHNPAYVKAIINNIEENLGMTITAW